MTPRRRSAAPVTRLGCWQAVLALLQLLLLASQLTLPARALSAPYRAPTRGGGGPARRGRRRARHGAVATDAHGEVTMPVVGGGGDGGLARATAGEGWREVNTNITLALEMYCTTNPPGSEEYYRGLDRFVDDIRTYCAGRDECWLAPYVRGVRAMNMFFFSGMDLDELANAAVREQARTNLFQYFDTNEDFRISLEEHLAGACALSRTPPRECSSETFRQQYRTRFDYVDANGNGFAEFDEFDATKSRAYGQLRRPYTRNPATIPVFNYLMEIYSQTYQYSIRQLLLLLTQVLVRVEPISPDLQQREAAAGYQGGGGRAALERPKQPPRIDSPTQLGLIPAPYRVSMDSGLDIVLVEAVLMRGAASYVRGITDTAAAPTTAAAGPLRPFVVDESVWAKVGIPVRQDLEAGRRAQLKPPPAGLSFLSMLRLARNDDATVGIVKVMFMAMDAVNLGAAASTAEGFRLLAKHSGQMVRSDQGHAFRIVYQSVHHASPTFRAWEAALDAAPGTAAVIHRVDAIRILEECNAYLLAGLTEPAVGDIVGSPGRSNAVAAGAVAAAAVAATTTGAVDAATAVAAAAAAGAARLRDTITAHSTHAPMRSSAADAPPPTAEAAAQLRMAYKLDLREVLMQGLSSGRNVLHDVAIGGQALLAQALCDAIHRQAPNAADGGAAGRAFVQAMRMGSTRLGRTPLHDAANWYSAGQTFHTLLACAEGLGANTEELLGLRDAMDFTPLDYAAGKHQVDLGNATLVQRIAEVIHAADEATGMKDPAANPDANMGGARGTGRSFTRAEPEGDLALDNGGWVAEPTESFAYLRDIPDPPEGVAFNVSAAALSMATAVRQGGRRLVAEVFEGMPSLNQMLAVVNSHRPVIFRGALRDLRTNRTVWSKAEFLKKYGNRTVAIADIPYRATFSSMLEGAAAETTLLMRDYVASFGTDEHVVDGVPLYMFSAMFTSDNPELNDECEEVLGFMNSLPGVQELHGGQFFVGPEGSGAPIHFHSSAVNALYYGRKRWVLIPPMQSFYSVRPAAAFFRDDVEEARKHYDMYEFVQEAGDLVYVPDYFGHGTVNLLPSIGIAFEFENFNHKLFNSQPDGVKRLQSTVPGSYRTLQYDI